MSNRMRYIVAVKPTRYELGPGLCVPMAGLKIEYDAASDEVDIGGHVTQLDALEGAIDNLLAFRLRWREDRNRARRQQNGERKQP